MSVDRGARKSREIDADEAAYISWEGQRERMNESVKPEAGRAAGLWAIDQLQLHLGDHWPEQTAGKNSQPGFVLAASYHARAFGELLDLALRLHLLRDIPGIAKVRRELQRDLAGGRRMHSGIILDVAGLARQRGHQVELERRARADRAPTDVVVTTPAGVIAIETFAVLLDAVTREGMAYSETIARERERICGAHGVWLSGHLRDGLGPDDTMAWLAEVETAAKLVAEDGETRVVDDPVGRVAIARLALKAGTSTFSGPPIRGGDPRRLGGILRKKAKQVVAAEGEWIRADVLDGLWQFTEWSTWTLLAKAEALAAEVRHSVSDIEGLRGAVLTCGPVLAQGTFVPESQKLSGGGYAIRRTFAPRGVRETVVIPLGAGYEAQAGEWLDMYDAEPDWLDWALSRVGLPPAADVFGPPDRVRGRP